MTPSGQWYLPHRDRLKLWGRTGGTGPAIVRFFAPVRPGVPLDVLVEGDCTHPLYVQIALYRVAEEALNNAGKHADASTVPILLACQPGHSALSISDDGRGFEIRSISPRHFGVGITRERADAIGTEPEIKSRHGQGTRVVAVWSEGEGNRTQG